MTYTTESNYTQSVSGNRDFNVGFPFLSTADIKVQQNSTTKTLSNDYTIVQSGANTTVNFNTAPADNDTIRLFRDTDIDAIEATYAAGSSIRASDLNTNNTQLLYAAQEFGTLKTDNSVSFSLGNKGDIQINSSTDYVINNNAVELAMMADNSVGTNELVNDSVTDDKMANNAIATANLKDNAVTIAKMSDNSVGTSEIVNDSVTVDKVANNAITTDQLASNAVTIAKMADNSVSTAEVVNSSVTLTKLATAVANSLNPVGTVIWYAGSTAPAGYLKANGDSIANGSGTTQSITTDFSALYAIVGANLPDLRGEFIRGWDDGKGTDSGRGIRSSQADANKEHSHGYTDPQIGGYIGLKYDGSGTTSEYVTANGGTTQTSGGTESRPRNIALLACIKY